MQTQEVFFFRHEALKTQKYVADHELLHFLKITNLYSYFKLWFQIMIRLVSFFYVG